MKNKNLIKKSIISVLDLFNSRPESARIYSKPEDIELKFQKIKNLKDNELFKSLARLYFEYNPNVYRQGNNARLYSQPYPEALIGAFIALLGNNSTGTVKSNPVAAFIEKEVFQFFADLVGYTTFDAIDTPSGTAANSMAVHIARFYFNNKFKTQGNTVGKIVLLTSDQSHYSQEIAMNRAGLGNDNITIIKTNNDGTMNIDDLDNAMRYHTKNGDFIIVCSTYGTTVLGAIDNIDEISRVCIKYREKGYKNIWHHIDATWGGPMLFHTAPYPENMKSADSVAFDTHKGFRATLTCGVFVTKHRNLLQLANEALGSKKYLHNDSNISKPEQGSKKLECGTPDRLMPFGTILLNKGVDDLTNDIQKSFHSAHYLIDIMKDHEEFILMHQPQYLNICIQIVSVFSQISHSKFTEMVSDHLLTQDSSEIMIQLCDESKSGTSVLRIVVNSAMNYETIHLIVQELLKAKNAVQDTIELSLKQVS